MANLVLTRGDSGVIAPGFQLPASATVGSALGLTGVALAVTFMVALHALGAAHISTISATLSDTVFTPGVGWMFSAGVLSMALAGAGALITLRASGLARGSLPEFAVTLASIGLLLVALFPTDPVGATSLSAEIHRDAAAVAMICLPLAALRVAAALAAVPELNRSARVLRRSALLTGAVLIVVGYSQLAPGSLEHARGLLQRIMLLCEALMLAQLVYLPARYARWVH